MERFSQPVMNAIESYPEFVPQSIQDPKQAAPQLHGGGETSARWSFWKRKWFWAVPAVVIVAAVVGGVVGGVLGRKTPSPIVNSFNQTSTTPTASTITATSTPTMSGTATALSSYTYPTALSWGYPHLEVFVPSSSVYWKYRGLNSSTPAWNPADGSFVDVGQSLTTFAPTIAALALEAGFMNIFITGSSGWNTYHNYHHLSPLWEAGVNWEDRYGDCTTAPVSVSWDANRIDLFVLGTDFDLWQQTWDSNTGWTSWTLRGGNWTVFTPTAVSWGKGRLDVFVVDPKTNELYHTYFENGSWQPSSVFESLGGYCTSRPTAVSWATGRLDVFVRGGDAGLWHLSYSGAWSNWTSISGNISIQAEPEAISWGQNRIDVFAWGMDQSLLHKSFDGTKWTPFENLGGGLAGPPKGVSDEFGSLHVFSMSRYGNLQHNSWNQTVGAWSPQGSFEDLGTPPGG